MSKVEIPDRGTLFGNWRVSAGTTPDHYGRKRVSVKCTVCLETKTVPVSTLLRDKVPPCVGCRRKAKTAR